MSSLIAGKLKKSLLVLGLGLLLGAPLGQARADNPLWSCMKAVSGWDAFSIATDLGNPACAGLYSTPTFDAIAGGIVALSAAGATEFQSSASCVALPSSVAGKLVAGIFAGLPGIPGDAKAGLQAIANGSSSHLVSEFVPPEILLFWNCACAFADLKQDFMKIAGDTSACANILGSALGSIAEGINCGLNVCLIPGVQQEQAGPLLPPANGCALSVLPAPRTGNCACLAPRMVLDGSCRCLGDKGFVNAPAQAQVLGQTISGGTSVTTFVWTQGSCNPCLYGTSVEAQNCQTFGHGCTVSCGLTLYTGSKNKCSDGWYGDVSCVCNKPHMGPSGEGINGYPCKCINGYFPTPDASQCVCPAPWVESGGKCILPACPGVLMHRDAQHENACTCPATTHPAPGPLGCACNTGVWSMKSAMCCKQLNANGTCDVAAPGSGGQSQCPPGQYYKPVGPHVIGGGTCTQCPAGTISNALGLACVSCGAGQVPDSTQSRCLVWHGPPISLPVPRPQPQ
jgi:hypothetical protein